MSEKTFIYGWNIKNGDFVSSGDYEKAYPSNKIDRLKREKIFFLIYNTIGLSGIVLILSLFSKL
ncbi:MAG: hypothetical protein Q8N03_14640 [Ignavibacteria bacterium]|jgi:hypothetical protein|nr:hypothetical protein [Ignavibacteria bacterium]